MEERDDKLELDGVCPLVDEAVSGPPLLRLLLDPLFRPDVSGVVNFSSVPAGSRGDLPLDGVVVVVVVAVGFCWLDEAVEGMGRVLSESLTMGFDVREEDDELLADLPPPPPLPECAAAFMADV